MIKGIGVVSLVHSAGKDEDFYPIDYRVYAPEVEGKTKNDHFQEMFVNAVDQKQIQARTSCLTVVRIGRELETDSPPQADFFTTLKSNRVVSLSKEQGYIHLEEIEWTPARLAQGLRVKLKEVPFQVRLFKLVAPTATLTGSLPMTLLRP